MKYRNQSFRINLQESSMGEENIPEVKDLDQKPLNDLPSPVKEIEPSVEDSKSISD